MLEQSSLLDEIRDMLLNSTLLNNFPPAEILSAARYFSINYVEMEEVIFGEGDMGTFMCLITEGTVSVQKSNQDGENIELARLQKDRTIGEMAVLDGERRSATCFAATDCTLLILSKDSLEKMILETPRIAAKVIRAIAVALSRRLRMADGKLVDYQG
ncbi:MAG: cyclic nucleotide-binding protein [Gallionellales bacterium 35-53-114]|jgi:CRP-like cAMP-binding protein|nr:MAG: cyclic nucleotide-binding protein [Gallionellales bacterium 35-53-114]OYZ62570.1 MAG: cyclic nucleotide-binding protein [Gallionellales bacterium 24-53-125]OZB09529.1 MAG: cyclic nucleotide-binding protein [Gallionellales bacterium 39-52-133]HQS57804.1 cyclic nucleotide-binding domain-containing protein [Gallionellaceae bacterium]HQS74257.1 cyclic nucleotide-binding domain-containing protein [Gallionellaceae bacterium]